MTTRVREQVKVLRDEPDVTVRAAAGAAMIGLLVGLCAFFVTFAPGT
jgi:hypothetical protein